MRPTLARSAVQLQVAPASDLMVRTPAQKGALIASMLLGPIGGAAGAMSTEARSKTLGRELVRQTGLQEPGAQLGQRLLTVLEQQFDVRHGLSPIHLTVATVHWLVSGDGLTSHLDVALTDTRNGQRLADAQCRYRSPKAERPKNLDAALADDAAFVKLALDKAVDECVGIVDRMLAP